MESLAEVMRAQVAADRAAREEGRPAMSPEDLGRAVARAVPRNWKITAYACLRARVPKDNWTALFRAFIEEQSFKPRRYKKVKGVYVVDEEDEEPVRQLSLGGL